MLAKRLRRKFGKPFIPPTRNITGLHWALDTNIIGNHNLKTLKKLFSLGWIYLETPDTVQFELTFTKDKKRKRDLLEERNSFPMPMGPTVLNHSQLGFSVNGSPQDEERLHEVHLTIWKSHTFEQDASVAELNTKARHRLRDTMIISTSIRYNLNTLVSLDDGLLEASSRLVEKYGIRVISLESATLEALAAVQGTRKKAQLMTNSVWYKNLPKWPH
jgi:predicted nucleic acid-binding protein